VKGEESVVRACLPIVVSLLCLSIQAPAQSLSGDFNRDCRVDFNDLARLSHRWLTNDPNVDINRDSRVNLRDFAMLARSWRQRECPIVINELLAHSHDRAPDWIELFNISSLRVDIGGWSLSDNKSNLGKYMIPEGTVVEPNGYVVFYEDRDFGTASAPGAQHPFRLSENGDSLYLYSGDDPNYPQFLVTETFGASETWVTFGRHLTSLGTFAFPLLSSATPGTANAYPLVGPVVINEIMYHPAVDTEAEYIELANESWEFVSLYDPVSLLPWRLSTSDGIEFSLPTDPPVVLGPREHILIAKSLAAVRRRYNVPADAQAFEWTSGKLVNSGGTISLWKPGDVDEVGVRYWIEVDRVAYSDGSHPGNFAAGTDPWPIAADGAGASLNRRFGRYGNDPNNWQASSPTPGTIND
jgi:hypothetical protein